MAVFADEILAVLQPILTTVNQEVRQLKFSFHRLLQMSQICARMLIPSSVLSTWKLFYISFFSIFVLMICFFFMKEYLGYWWKRQQAARP